MEMPYWATNSNCDFHTSVTSHAFVACNRQERKAETAFPPTVQTLVLGIVHTRSQSCERVRGQQRLLRVRCDSFGQGKTIKVESGRHPSKLGGRAHHSKLSEHIGSVRETEKGRERLCACSADGESSVPERIRRRGVDGAIVCVCVLAVADVLC